MRSGNATTIAAVSALTPAEPREPLEDWQHGGFGAYVHWPFCAAKCPYCDFNSHVAGAVDQARWARAYGAEIARLAAEVGRRRLDTVFFGGGTPSLMAPETVAAVMEALRSGFDLAADAEVTMEANPTSVEAGRFRAYAGAGVNRLSLGVQALQDADLKRLGRMHTAAEARAAFEVARGAFGRVSFDLIYARQGQGLEDWRAELQAALAMAADHLSLYQLTIEAGTVFAARAALGQLRGLPADDLAADMYLMTQDICGEAGLPAYEVSNHAAPAAESRHNLIYWRSGDWLGIGPGAHGRLSLGGRRLAIEAPRPPGEWLAAVEAGRGGESGREVVPRVEQAAEHLMMGLRLSAGVSLARHAALAGSALDAGVIAGMDGAGLVRVADGRLKATPSGRAVLNAVIRELLA